MSEELTKDQYIFELEKALIFMCDIYNQAYNSLARYKETESDEMNDKYIDLWLTFPMIQGTTAQCAVSRISELRDVRSNYVRPSISLETLYEHIKANPKLYSKEQLEEMNNLPTKPAHE